MQKLAANLTEKMLRRKLISPEQAEWCAYLVECKLEQMLCFSVLIALGCPIAPLWEEMEPSGICKRDGKEGNHACPDGALHIVDIDGGGKAAGFGLD